MAFIKYLVPALAAGSAVLASSSDSCDGSKKAVNIQSQGDADALASCTTVKGDITISKEVQSGLIFNGIEQITGSLTAVNAANVTSISAPLLAAIGDVFELSGILQLTSLSMPSLTDVGSINFIALPLLQSLDFTKGVSKVDTDVSIQNTGLYTLTGIALKSVRNFDLTSNTALASVNVANIKNVTGLLTFAANSPSLKVDLPNLVGAQNMTIHNTSSLLVPSLAELTGQLGLFGNSFTSFSAPNLTQTGDLVFDDNASMTNISLPLLTKISGGFQIARNDDLKAIDGVPKLQTIIGALDWTGNFNNVSLPSLKEIQGGFNMQSTGHVPCSTFDNLKGGVIRGSYKCSSESTNPTTIGGSSGSNSTSTGSGSASATSSSAAMADLGHIPVTGLTAVVGALLSLLM